MASLFDALYQGASYLKENPLTTDAVVRALPSENRIILTGLAPLSDWAFASVFTGRDGSPHALLIERDSENEAVNEQNYRIDPQHALQVGMNVRLVVNDVEANRLVATLNDRTLGSPANLQRLERLLLEPAAALQRLSLNIVPRPIKNRLNHEQAEAVRMALSKAPLTLIQGPPGTGKTTVITEIIRQAVEAGHRVMCLAPTNQAVDNVIHRLEREKLAFTPIRIGNPEKMRFWEYSDKNRLTTLQECLKARWTDSAPVWVTPPETRPDPFWENFQGVDALGALQGVIEAEPPMALPQAQAHLRR